jgi:NAD(P)H-hydrate epimerase
MPYATPTPFWLSRAEVRELDRRAIEEFGVPGIVLMENAGRGAAEVLMRLNPERLPVTILCGPGNNGGDGFVMARHLDIHDYPVQIWLALRGDDVVVDRRPDDLGQRRLKLSADAQPNFRAAIASGIGMNVVRGSMNDRQREMLGDHLTPRTGWIVDALFGTGLDRALGPPFDEVVAAINASDNPVLAVDIPSGLDCDTGKPLGPTVKAAHTATFVGWKKGFLEPSANEWIGEVRVVDIGAPKKLVDHYRALRLGG